MKVSKRRQPVAVPLIGSVWIILGAALLGLGALELYWAAPAGSTVPTTGAAAYVSEDLKHEGVRWSAYLGGGVSVLVGVVGAVFGVCFVARVPGSRFAIEVLTWLALASVPGLMTYLSWFSWATTAEVGSGDWGVPVLALLPYALVVIAGLGFMIRRLRRYDIAEAFRRPEASDDTD